MGTRVTLVDGVRYKESGGGTLISREFGQLVVRWDMAVALTLFVPRKWTGSSYR